MSKVLYGVSAIPFSVAAWAILSHFGVTFWWGLLALLLWNIGSGLWDKARPWGDK